MLIHTQLRKKDSPVGSVIGLMHLGNQSCIVGRSLNNFCRVLSSEYFTSCSINRLSSFLFASSTRGIIGKSISFFFFFVSVVVVDFCFVLLSSLTLSLK